MNKPTKKTSCKSEQTHRFSCAHATFWNVVCIKVCMQAVHVGATEFSGWLIRIQPLIHTLSIHWAPRHITTMCAFHAT